MKQPMSNKDAAKARDLKKEGALWIERIKSATKDEKEWLDDAGKAQKAYTGEAKAAGDVTADELGNTYDFNILYANVETIVPAVINSPPVPDIRRRFNDPDPAARLVADLMERAIRVQIDDSRLQIELEGAAQDAFLAGRGIVRLRYKSDIKGGETKDDELLKAADNNAETVRLSEHDNNRKDEGDSEYGGGSGIQPASGPSDERLENERICFEAVSWRDYRHGPAARWEDRPWEAFRFCIAREDEDNTFDSSLIGIQVNDPEREKRSASNDLTGWEIWCKKTKKVKFVDDDGVILKVVDDPLGLAGFYSISTPMQPIELVGRLRPVNPFSIYRKLADELDDITKRINRIVDAMKVKGWYAGLAKDLENVISLADNEFAPIADAELWAQNGGIEGAIAFWPIERFAATLKELYAARNETKQAIYEITGISDIVRGASKATETLGAQEIKSQWGSLRIQKMQRMLERCARDLFVMMSEIIPTKFSRETLEKMTGIPLLPSPNDDPETLAQKQAVDQLLSQRLASYYRIDVESDSTVRADLTRQKQEVAEFLQGASAYFQAVAPLVQQGALPADAAVDIFAATARMFNLGKSVEDTLEKMVTDAKAQAQQPKQEKPDPEAIKAQAEQAKAQSDMESKQLDAQLKQQEFQMKAGIAQQDAQMRAQEFQAKMQAEMAKAEIDGQKAQVEAAIKVMDQEMKQIELQIKQIELQKAMSAPEGEAAKPPSESISFKDLPPEGQAQMAAQAGIILTPEQIENHVAEQAEQKAKEAAAKSKKEPA